MSNVERKTGEIVQAQPLSEIVIAWPRPQDDPTKNILHKFRTFNYLFTLSACPATAMNDTNKIIQASKDFVIAKSAGKQVNQLSTSSDVASLVESFNSRSPGRFDLFMNNVEIETLMSFNETTNFSMATKIRFEIFENLSINGFIEALQVSAQAAGNYSYMGSPFILKVEFRGFVDDDKTATDDVVNAGRQATRYIVINITKVEVEMTEAGTRYRCQAVAFNEMGFGDQNALAEPMQMKGATVEAILVNLMEGLTEASKLAVAAEAAKKNNTDATLYDEYSIIFPTPNWDTGIFDYNKPWDKIKKAAVVEVSENPSVFAFPSPSEVSNAYNPPEAGSGKGFINPTFDPNVVIDTRISGSRYVYNADKISVTFPKNAKIHDIISAVIRDSAFGRNIVKKFKENTAEILKEQMIEWFHVAVEVEQKAKFSAVFQRPIYKYKFVVLPYKMHFSRIPLLQVELKKSQQDTLQKLFVLRKYDYLYTGKNVDIRKFNLTFNHLFYQAVPRLLGNAYFNRSVDTEQGAPREGMQLNPPVGTQRQSDVNSGSAVRNTQRQSNSRRSNNPVRVNVPQSPRLNDPRRSAITGPGGNATIPAKDNYDMLLKNMHQAILDNTAMIKCDLEITGDPYFLVTGGIGNHRPRIINNTRTENGEAPYQTNDVIVQLEFKNPEDIDPKTGMVIFNPDRVAFSGCYRVTKVVNKFNDGLFTQNLLLLRIPGQAINNVSPESSAPAPRTNTRVSSAATDDTGFFTSVPLAQINIPSDNTA